MDRGRPRAPGGASRRGPQAQGGGGRALKNIPCERFAGIRRAHRAGAAEPAGRADAGERRGEPRCALVSDDTVYSLYGERAKQSLEGAGYRVVHLRVPARRGEQDHWTLYGRLLNFLCERHLTRTDPVRRAGRRRGGRPGGLRRGDLPARRALYSGSHHAAGHGGLAPWAARRPSTCPAVKTRPGCFYQPRLVRVRPGRCCPPCPSETVPLRLRRGHQVRRAGQRCRFFRELADDSGTRRSEEHVIATVSWP